jgi:hypothetical protein
VTPIFRFRRLVMIVCGCFLLCLPTAGRAIGLPPVPVPPVPAPPKLPNINIPDLSQLLNGEAITTSLSDAVTAIPFLNDYQPYLARDLTAVPREANGTFNLVAGSYWFNGRSYC